MYPYTVWSSTFESHSVWFPERDWWAAFTGNPSAAACAVLLTILMALQVRLLCPGRASRSQGATEGPWTAGCSKCLPTAARLICSSKLQLTRAALSIWRNITRALSFSGFTYLPRYSTCPEMPTPTHRSRRPCLMPPAHCVRTTVLTYPPINPQSTDRALPAHLPCPCKVVYRVITEGELDDVRSDDEEEEEEEQGGGQAEKRKDI